MLRQAIAFIDEQLFRLAENIFAADDRAKRFDKLIHCANRVAGTGCSFNAKFSGLQITQILLMGKKSKVRREEDLPQNSRMQLFGCGF